MLNETDRMLFSAALAELGINLHKAHVTDHANSLPDFTRKWGRPARIFRASNGVEVHVWRNLQEGKKGLASDIYAADFGTARAFHVKN